MRTRLETAIRVLRTADMGLLHGRLGFEIEWEGEVPSGIAELRKVEPEPFEVTYPATRYSYALDRPTPETATCFGS